MCNCNETSESEHRQDTDSQSDLYFTELRTPIEDVDEIRDRAAEKSKQLNRIHNLATKVDCDFGSVSVEVANRALMLEIYVHEIHGAVDTLVKEFDWDGKSISCHWDEDETIDNAGQYYHVSLSLEVPTEIPRGLE